MSFWQTALSGVILAENNASQRNPLSGPIIGNRAFNEGAGYLPDIYGTGHV